MSNEVKEEQKVQLVFEDRPKTLEERLSEMFLAKLNDGSMETMVEKYAHKAIEEAMNDVFKSYGGGLGKMIEDKFKEILTPIIDKYNFAEHLVKMEDVLDEMIKEIAKPNKDILESFKKLVSVPMDKITMSELFKHYEEFVARNMSTVDREIDYDSGQPEYEPVEVRVYFEETSDSYSWSKTKYGQLVFEVQDGIDDDKELEKLNFLIPIMMFDDRDYWTIRYMGPVEIKDLRHMDEFEVLLRSLNQMYTSIIIDEDDLEETVYSEEKPEAIYE